MFDINKEDREIELFIFDIFIAMQKIKKVFTDINDNYDVNLKYGRLTKFDIDAQGEGE